MANPQRNEVWLVDLGMVAKIRPCLVLSVEPDVADRDLATVIPHTTSVRGTSWEVVVEKNYLARGAFEVQNIMSVSRSNTKFLRRLGRLDDSQMLIVESMVKRWLGITG